MLTEATYRMGLKSYSQYACVGIYSKAKEGKS